MTSFSLALNICLLTQFYLVKYEVHAECILFVYTQHTHSGNVTCSIDWFVARENALCVDNDFSTLLRYDKQLK